MKKMLFVVFVQLTNGSFDPYGYLGKTPQPPQVLLNYMNGPCELRVTKTKSGPNLTKTKTIQPTGLSDPVTQPPGPSLISYPTPFQPTNK